MPRVTLVHADKITPQTLPGISKENTYEVVKCGKMLLIRKANMLTTAPKSNARGTVMGFSRQSRMRLLKTIAQIDWSKTGKTTFLTLTCPDECWPKIAKEWTAARWNLMKLLEHHTKRKLCGIWRTEWQLRKTGARTGEPMPHYHLLIFDCPYVSWTNYTGWWEGSLKYVGIPRINVTQCKDTLHAAKYAAKYAAKPDDGFLVNGTYVGMTGYRPWGLLRGGMVPMHPRTFLRLPHGILSDEVWTYAAGLIRGRIDVDARSVTMLGENATDVFMRILERGLAKPAKDK